MQLGSCGNIGNTEKPDKSSTPGKTGNFGISMRSPNMDTAGITRVFLPWDRPAMEQVTAWLLNHCTSGGGWAETLIDLSNHVLVFPGGRAGRLVLDRLAEAAESHSASLLLPTVATVGELAERLYPQQRPFASETTQRLSWAKALQEADPQQLAQFVPAPPGEDQMERWYELAELLWRQHRELAAEGLDFAQVAQRGTGVEGFGEQSRWHALSTVQRRYLDELDQRGLWDRQTARLVAIRQRECRTDQHIVLVGTVDITRALRQMLDQVADQVTALVFCDPQTDLHRFDAHGCLIPGQWRDYPVAELLEDSHILQVDRPMDQARATVCWLAELAAEYSPDQIAIGVPNESLVPMLQQQLSEHGIAHRWGPGKPADRSRVVKLLRILADYLRHRTFADLAELLRHIDIQQWLAKQGVGDGYLASMDRLAEEHLPQTEADLRALLSDRAAGRPPTDEVETPGTHAGTPLPDALERLDKLLAPLSGRRPAAEWRVLLLELLKQLFADAVLDMEDSYDRELWFVCRHVAMATEQLADIPDGLLGSIDGFSAILLTLEMASELNIPSPEAVEAVELLGWLELPLDDRPALIVTSVNEGIIPTSSNADLFLPDRIRQQLDVNDNLRRYARDVYALSFLAHSRRQLRLIVGSKTSDGDPLTPSRLLLAGSDELRVHRSLRLFDERNDQSRVDAAIGPTDSARTGPSPAEPRRPDDTGPGTRPPEEVRGQARGKFVVPHPEPLSVEQRGTLATLSVTDFKRYLRCPYRFYLQRVLGLRMVDDQVDELPANTLGSIAHEVLDQFGRTPSRHACASQDIEDELLTWLDTISKKTFGSDPPATVRVQLAQLRYRLQRFAQEQARRRLDGWRILATEGELGTLTVPWPLGGSTEYLRGRIDRIDIHESTGCLAIIDYKTSSYAEHPHKVHHWPTSTKASTRLPDALSPDDWHDLQLPLYRHLVGGVLRLLAERLPDDLAHQPLAMDGLQLEYAILCSDPDATSFVAAQWKDHHLKAADERAEQVAQSIQDEVFWPPSDEAESYDDIIEVICQRSLLAPQLEVP